MKALLIVDDAQMENPEWHPPDARKDRVAYRLYCARVPCSISAPKGMVLEADNVDSHCLPDNEGVVRAVPLDDDCKTIVEWKKKSLTPRQLALIAAAEKAGEPLVAEYQKAQEKEAKKASKAEKEVPSV